MGQHFEKRSRLDAGGGQEADVDVGELGVMEGAAGLAAELDALGGDALGGEAGAGLTLHHRIVEQRVLEDQAGVRAGDQQARPEGDGGVGQPGRGAEEAEGGVALGERRRRLADDLGFGAVGGGDRADGQGRLGEQGVARGVGDAFGLQQVVDGREARRVGIARPGDLDRGGAQGQDAKAATGAVTGHVDQDVEIVGAEQFGGGVVVETIERADLFILGRAAAIGQVEDRIDGGRVVVGDGRQGVALQRLGVEAGGEVADAERAAEGFGDRRGGDARGVGLVPGVGGGAATGAAVTHEGAQRDQAGLAGRAGLQHRGRLQGLESAGQFAEAGEGEAVVGEGVGAGRALRGLGQGAGGHAGQALAHQLAADFGGVGRMAGQGLHVHAEIAHQGQAVENAGGGPGVDRCGVVAVGGQGRTQPVAQVRRVGVAVDQGAEGGQGGGGSTPDQEGARLGEGVRRNNGHRGPPGRKWTVETSRKRG